MSTESETDDLGSHGGYYLNGLFDPYGTKTPEQLVETAYYVNVLDSSLKYVLIIKAFIEGHHTKAIDDYHVEEGMREIAMEYAIELIDQGDFSERDRERNLSAWFAKKEWEK